MNIRKKSIGIFQDDSGNRYEIIEYIKQKKLTLQTGKSKYLDASKSAKTSCGKELNYGKEGRFMTLDGTVLTPV